MISDVKNWLVRTRTGDILGPFTQNELLTELQKKTFSSTDEIAPASGFWISAQTLLNHDRDEFTQTSTRNTAITQATISRSDSSIVRGSQPINPNDELTPTPDFGIAPPSEPPIKRTPSAKSPTKLNSKIIPLLGGLAVITGLWLMVNYLKPTPPKSPLTEVKVSHSRQIRSQSPFVREMYKLINTGQTGLALKKLTLYHEKQASDDDMEYLIPYTALLIVERESAARARKLLEKVLATSTNRQLKARAHHWLGYLMLSQDERDMGENHFLESLQLNPKDAAARFNLGRAYLKQEKYRQALDYLQLAELEVPDLWLVHIYKGRAKAALDLKEEAHQSFKRAIALSKDRWVSYIYHALFLKGQGRNRAARLLVKVMLTRDPNYEFNSPPPLGFFHERVNYAEYLNAFIHIMQGGPSEGKELGRLYISYLLNGPKSEEAKRIEAVAEKGGLIAKILALKVLLDTEASPAKLKKAIKRLPKHLAKFGFYAYVLRGEAYMRLGLLNRAKSDFTTALTIEPHSAVSRWALATLLNKESKRTRAREEIEDLLSHHPNYIPAIVTSQNF